MNTTIFIFGVMYFQTMIHGNRYQPESPRASNLPPDQVKNSSISWPSSSTVGNVECPVEMFNFFFYTQKHSLMFISCHTCLQQSSAGVPLSPGSVSEASTWWKMASLHATDVGSVRQPTLKPTLKNINFLLLLPTHVRSTTRTVHAMKTFM